MKKVYIEPQMKSFALRGANLLSNSIYGDGLRMTISNEGASGAAEGRDGFYFDEDEE